MMATNLAALEQARAKLQAGRFAEAERLLRGLLDPDRESPEAMELLGACLGAQGRHQEALECLDKALGERATPSAGLLHNRAQALLSLGRVAEARAILAELVARAPEFAAAWSALGRASAAIGELQAAEHAYREALRLTHGAPEAHYALGNFLHAVGRPSDAIEHYRKAIAARPQFAEALSNYGTALRETGRPEEALVPLERAAQLQPRSPTVVNNLGIGYYEMNRLAEAETCYRRVLSLDPRIDQAYINLGNVLAAQGRQDEAIEYYRTVIQRSPNNPDAHANLGIALHDLDRVDEAMRSYQQALALDPEHAVALNNLGYLFEQQGRSADAKALYRRALERNPALARARFNLAHKLLRLFEFEEGWRLLDESRFDITPVVAVRRKIALPLFQGEWQQTRRLAIWREQGVGDQLLYATLLPDLERRGIDFVAEVDARLLPAFRRSRPTWSVVGPDESEAAFVDCDRHTPIGSLPRWLRPTRESFAAQSHSLLEADAERARDYRERLRPASGRLIGISWRSYQPKARAYLERRKSAPLGCFRELSLREDVKLLDLQYGETAAERQAFAAEGGRLARVEGLDLFNDLDGVLAAIEACDLVVTTSNVTAHLAGAIGKETWLLYLRGVPPFYYWAADEEGRCLWYPSVRILTGGGADTWENLLGRVGRLLDERAR